MFPLLLVLFSPCPSPAPFQAFLIFLSHLLVFPLASTSLLSLASLLSLFNSSLPIRGHNTNVSVFVKRYNICARNDPQPREKATRAFRDAYLINSRLSHVYRSLSSAIASFARLARSNCAALPFLSTAFPRGDGIAKRQELSHETLGSRESSLGIGIGRFLVSHNKAKFDRERGKNSKVPPLFLRAVFVQLCSCVYVYVCLSLSPYLPYDKSTSSAVV